MSILSSSPIQHASPHCACGINGLGERITDPICVGGRGQDGLIVQAPVWADEHGELIAVSQRTDGSRGVVITTKRENGDSIEVRLYPAQWAAFVAAGNAAGQP